MIAVSRAKLILALLAAAALPVFGLPGEGNGQTASRTVRECGACHGEMELLRQHVESSTRARELVVTADAMRGTGHGGMACAECHSGYTTFPHPPERTATDTCAACHEEAQADWTAGQHALRDAAGEVSAPCAACHGVHGVATAEQLAAAPARERMDAQCVACHQPQALPASDPHAGEAGCWACHGPHRVHAVDDSESWVAPARQARTCGACHEDALGGWSVDAHGAQLQKALATPGAVPVLPLAREAPTCTGCHGGHGMVATDDEAFPAFAVERCADCHADYADTFFGTYHGKATALGSRIAASCADCHGAHGIFAQDDPRSTVHEANLIQTCGECHANARPAFVLYDSHPELLNWRRNPVLTGSFVFMNGLLVFVLLVFGSHTVLWWVRLVIDRRRGVGHGGHGGSAPHHETRSGPDDGANG